MLKISILTLSFNQAEFLEQCIDSVLSQSYPNWELIILDPGSSDSSREIAAKYASLDGRIRIYFEKDQGPSDGLNKGLSICSGEIIGCLNSDDFYRQGVFHEVAKAFLKYGDADCVYSHGSVMESGLTRFQTSDLFSISRYFSNRGLVLQQSTFFRKSSLDRMKMSFNVENTSSWDGEFLLDLAARNAKFKRVFGNWGVFRIYPTSITGSQRLKDKSEKDHLRMHRAHAKTSLLSQVFTYILLKVPVYSILRRVRNLIFFWLWSLYHRSGRVL
jgi:glycosyltransferase involved in cell wall biosynthesis